VKEGYQVARLIDCRVKPSRNPDWADQFEWDLEIFNPEAPTKEGSGYARLWTGQSLHSKSHLTPLAAVVFGAKTPVGDTDAFLGKPFKVFIDHQERDGTTYGNARKMYKPLDGDNPFTWAVDKEAGIVDEDEFDLDSVPF